MAHRCCGWLELRRATAAIALFYVCYLSALAVTAVALAVVYRADPAAPVRFGLAAGGLLLLALLAGGLLAGTLRRRRGLLLLWLLAYGAALTALTVAVLALAVAAELGQRTVLTELCASGGGRCSWRLFHYLLLLYAVEWYWWQVVLLRYWQLGRAAPPESPPPPPGVTVRAAHNGRLCHVPVTYYGDKSQPPTAAFRPALL